MPCDISVIICTRSRKDSISKCLAAIPAKEMLQARGELILVDNASTDGTLKVLTSFRDNATFPVTVVSEPTPGLSTARNTGFSKASGQVLFFTDDDCYIAGGTILAARSVFETQPFHYCGGRLLPYDPSDAQYGFNEQDKFELIPPRSVVPAGHIPGGLMVFHRVVFDKIGGFDPLMGTGTFLPPCRARIYRWLGLYHETTGEDVDFCARASMAGFTGARVPELIVYHHHRRKEGPEIERIKKRDQYGVGACYAKLVLMGHLPYLRHWGACALYSQPATATMRQIRGALGYACTKVFHPKRPGKPIAPPDSAPELRESCG